MESVPHSSYAPSRTSAIIRIHTFTIAKSCCTCCNILPSPTHLFPPSSFLLIFFFLGVLCDLCGSMAPWLCALRVNHLKPVKICAIDRDDSLHRNLSSKRYLCVIIKSIQPASKICTKSERRIRICFDRNLHRSLNNLGQCQP
jgi:hypothetical protein